MIPAGRRSCLSTGAFLLVATAWIGGCTGASAARPFSAPGTRPEPSRIVFTSADGLEFEAAVERPPAHASNGWSVLMIGGGLGNDLDWVTPGRVEQGGQWIDLTITGEPIADAPPISDALTERGFVVMRWSTLALDDPLRDQWPARATPRSLAQTLDDARRALAALRAAPGVTSDRIILLGHSLGAARAWTIAADDPGVGALILLAPAYATPPDPPPRALTEAGVQPLETALRARPVPCLAIFGALDESRAVDAEGAKGLLAQGLAPTLEVRIIEGRGHNLGPAWDGRAGPMDAQVAALIAQWTTAAIHGSAE